MEIFYGILIIFVIFIILITLVTSVLMVIATWKLFTKAGIDGWKSLIPIYNTILLLQISGVSLWWLLITIIAPLLTTILPLFGLLSFAVSIYFTVLYSVSIARSYGKDDGFAVGLIFLPIVFFPILGFGKSRYLGPRPMKDIIFGNNTQNNNNFNNSNTNNNNMNNANVQEANLVCSNCNSPIIQGTAYCTKCGTRI